MTRKLNIGDRVRIKLRNSNYSWYKKGVFVVNDKKTGTGHVELIELIPNYWENSGWIAADHVDLISTSFEKFYDKETKI